MTRPKLDTINTKSNCLLRRDSDQEEKMNQLVEELKKLRAINVKLLRWNIICICIGIILFLLIGWFSISNYRHMKELENEKDLKSLVQLMDQAIHLREMNVRNMILASTDPSSQCVIVKNENRFDCHPESDANEASCIERGCCWNSLNKNNDEQLDNDYDSVSSNIPSCYYPKNWQIYEYENATKENNEFSAFLHNTSPSYYKNDIETIKIEAVSIDSGIMRVKIFDPSKKRYEPLWPIRNDPVPFKNNVNNAAYIFETDDTAPGFRIKRVDNSGNNNGIIIFDSITPSNFIFSDQFLQISTLLPSNNIYGLGEHRSTLKLDTNWQTLTFFSRDAAPVEQANLYGTHPFYMIMEDNGNSHGVLFLNSNAMDVVLQPTPALTFRSIGGIFDIYFFMGPTPTDVLRQYSEIIGKPFLPPYWSLGFHLCRFGTGSLKRTREIWNRTRAAGIPFDTQWNDLDYMENRNNFEYDKELFKELPQFVKELHELGMHYIPIIDPGISSSEPNGTYVPYDEGIRDDIFIKDNSTNLPFNGKVWNLGSTVFPDFTHPKANEYWYKMMKKMHDEFEYDGAWIDMNEPSNFFDGLEKGCTPNALDQPPYVPNVLGNLLASKTLCMNAKQYAGYHYDLHNNYAMGEAIATNEALVKIRQKRPFIVSRSSSPGLGYYSAHWTGDIFSKWHDLKISIPEILSNGLYQIPMVGADICGFNGNTTKELCNRWMQLGAFYPFSRNHNSDDTIDQDPVAMGDLTVKSSRKALMIRYRFLPYLYTLLFRAHRYGETVARPLFIEFPEDTNTYNIDTQFLWGSGFMIAPVLEDNTTNVNVYLPNGVWYDFYNKTIILSKGDYYNFNAPIDTIPLIIRGGYILPAQVPAKTTTNSRKNNFELLIGINEAGNALGELYWDDGDSNDSIDKLQYRWITFMLQNQTLHNTQTHNGVYKENMILGKIQIMGIIYQVKKVYLNNKQIKFIYDDKRSFLTIKNLNIDLKDNFILSWI